jgi:hypothetical protein
VSRINGRSVEVCPSYVGTAVGDFAASSSEGSMARRSQSS